jgi:hypothetical protein
MGAIENILRQSIPKPRGIYSMKRNIFGMMLVMFCVLAITPAVFAQTTVKLFDPVYLNADDTITQATSYRTNTVYLSCQTSQTGTLSGATGGSLIVDDFLTVNGTNVCPFGSCFSYADDYSYFPARDNPGQYPVDSFYGGVGPLQIQLAAGTNPYTFNLMNGGGSYGSTEINLDTNCTVVPAPQAFPAPVCHRNNGASGQKTIIVGSQGALDAHLAHGDTAGPCTTGQ